MTPDAAWPSIPNYGKDGFTAEDHAAHTTPKGIPYPHDLIPGQKATAMAKLAMKFATKPHLKMKAKAPRAKPVKRRKK